METKGPSTSTVTSTPSAATPPSVVHAQATPTDSVNQEVSGHEVLLRLLPEMMALDVSELIPITVDVRQVVAMVFGLLPGIREHREAAAAVQGIDMTLFDKLEDCTVALNDAQFGYMGATGPADEFENWTEEAARLRELLLSEANTQALRGLVNDDKLDELKGTVGYKNLASDLGVLYKILRANWAQIQGRTSLSTEELDRADKLSLHLMRAIGLRERSPAVVAEATDRRARMFTLFVRSYDVVRRAISYLRWNHEDADKIAPSLYSARATRRKGTDVSTDPNTPGAGSGAPGQPVGAVGSGTLVPPGSAVGAAHADGESAVDPARGTPDADPFLT